MTKKLYLGNCKFKFGEANGEAMFPAETEYLSEVIHMWGKIFPEDEDVIFVDKTEY